MFTPPNFARQGMQANSAQRGSVLLEALVAILLFSMGVLALVGLQAAMIKNTADSKSRSEASYIAQQWIGRMWADQGNLNFYLIATNQSDPRYKIPLLLPNGEMYVTQPTCAAPWDTTVNPITLASQCPYVITVKWQQPGQTQHQFTTTFTIS